MVVERAPRQIVTGVGGVIWNAGGEILLIRRANPPLQNEWSLPGGRVEFGEPLRAALLREIREETRLEVEILGLVDVAELISSEADALPRMHHVLVDFSARLVSGVPAAASDALEVRWFTLKEIARLRLWDETRRIINMSAKDMNVGVSD